MLSLSLDGKRARAAVRSSPSSSSLKAGHGVVAPSSARRVGRPERRMGRPIAVRRPAGRTISSVLDASATRPVGPSVGPLCCAWKEPEARGFRPLGHMREEERG